MLLRDVTRICLWLLLMAGGASADPAGSYLQARQAAPQPLLTGSQIADVLLHPGSYAGRTLEAAAPVSGLVTAGEDRTALLSVGTESVVLPLPASLTGASWLASGVRVRVLLRVAPDDPALPSGLRLIAIAPEGDVAAAEQRLAAERAAALTRQASLPSRSLPLRRGGRRVTWVADSMSQGHPAGALSPRALAIYGPYRSLVRRWNRRLSETDVDKITTSILYFSDLNNIDPRLVVATIIAESDFDLYSTSHAGAMGLAQIMPDEAHSLGVTNAYDPIQNIGAAVHLLRGHLDKYGGAPANGGVIPFNQIALTMAAYNAGPGAVRKYHGVPPYRETQRYIKRITALYRQMCGLSSQQASVQ